MYVARKNSRQGAREPVMRQALLVMASATLASATSNVSRAQGILPQGGTIASGQAKIGPPLGELAFDHPDFIKSRHRLEQLFGWPGQ